LRVARDIASNTLAVDGPLLEFTNGEVIMTTPTVSRPGNDRQLALFVGGDVDALAMVEPVLEGQAYDVEFVATDDEPYGTITALKPDLVVISLSLDEPAGFELLTMLRLDPDTAAIPVLSYVRDEDVAALGPAPVDHNPSRLASVRLARAQRH
jgi:PleD family two-component response regulator